MLLCSASPRSGHTSNILSDSFHTPRTCLIDHTGQKGQCGSFSPFFHFRCDIHCTLPPQKQTYGETYRPDEYVIHDPSRVVRAGNFGKMVAVTGKEQADGYREVGRGRKKM